jgi:hypothetical protein
VPISTISIIEKVVENPHIKGKLISSKNPHTGMEAFLPPPLVITSYLKSAGMQLPFPPRWGEHNAEIYGKVLGCGANCLADL